MVPNYAVLTNRFGVPKLIGTRGRSFVKTRHTGSAVRVISWQTVARKLGVRIASVR